MSVAVSGMTRDEFAWASFKRMSMVIMLGACALLGGGLLRFDVDDALTAWATVLSLMALANLGRHLLQRDVRLAVTACSIPIAFVALALVGESSFRALMVGLPQDTALAYLSLVACMAISVSALAVCSFDLGGESVAWWRGTAVWLYFALPPVSCGYALYALTTNVSFLVPVCAVPAALCAALLLGLFAERYAIARV